MSRVPFSNSKYSYVHHGNQKGSPQAIDIHEVSISRSRTLVLISYCSILLFIANSCYLCYLLLVQEKLHSGSIWSLFASIILAKFLQYRTVKKESVVIMPEFGVQLETHHMSGRVTHRFVPIGKILRPVLNECVTPATCYWSLALILHGEAELMLVFQELQPPLKMLVPVWNALCAVTDGKHGSSS